MLMTTYLLIGVNVLISLIAFSRMNSETGHDAFLFSPSDVSAGRNYTGMFLSHFSHADGTHLFFNMMTFYFFGPVVEDFLGTLSMLLIYVSAGILSTLVVYYRHRGDPKYRSLGASDSITGILFAAIVVDPGMSLYLFFIPYPIPAPLFAVVYILLSTYFMRRGEGHISHEAHLAGAFAGLVLAGLLAPGGFSRLLQELQSYLT